MGYACPVCETPQQDAEHLANHMAITGMVRDEAHADWLDDRVDGWREGSPAALAAELVDLAEPVDYDQAAVEFADLPDGAEDGAVETGGTGHGHDHSHGHATHDYAAEHGNDHRHQHAHEHAHDETPLGVETAELSGADGVSDAEVEAILEEARELTRQQFEDAAVEGEAEGEAEDASDDTEGS